MGDAGCTRYNSIIFCFFLSDWADTICQGVPSALHEANAPSTLGSPPVLPMGNSGRTTGASHGRSGRDAGGRRYVDLSVHDASPASHHASPRRGGVEHGVERPSPLTSHSNLASPLASLKAERGAERSRLFPPRLTPRHPKCAGERGGVVSSPAFFVQLMPSAGLS